MKKRENSGRRYWGVRIYAGAEWSGESNSCGDGMVCPHEVRHKERILIDNLSFDCLSPGHLEQGVVSVVW